MAEITSDKVAVDIEALRVQEPYEPVINMVPDTPPADIEAQQVHEPHVPEINIVPDTPAADIEAPQVQEPHVTEISIVSDLPSSDDDFFDLDSYISTDGDEEAPSSFRREDLPQDWVSSIQRRNLIQPQVLKASSHSRSCSIHRVPEWIRGNKPSAYAPQFISIGPFHYSERKKRLLAMEEHKRRYLANICTHKPQGWLEDCLVTIQGCEERARNYYSEEITMDSNSFVEMMVLDGCFLVELFRRFWPIVKHDDFIIQLQWPKKILNYDLILLENQIPFFILERLSDLMDDSRSYPPLLESALHFLFPSSYQRTAEEIRNSNTKIRHLLHLRHEAALVLSTINDRYTKSGEPVRIPCASKLKERGIRFKTSDTGRLGIKYNKGVIEISPLHFWGKAEILFLNLIAFEQYYLHCRKFVTSFFFFMDCLINTEKDVEILCQDGIITNDLGNDERVASLFNNMTKEAFTYLQDFYFTEACNKINEYSENRCRKLRASLVHDYFYNPWAIISFLAALLLLLLTLTQTFFASFPKFASGK